MLDFEFIPPEEEAKVSGKGKKKTKVHTKVHIKHYYDKGDIEGHYRTTTTCLNVMDHTTIQDAQEVLNKAVNLPALTPMVWFVGKEGDGPVFRSTCFFREQSDGSGAKFEGRREFVFFLVEYGEG